MKGCLKIFILAWAVLALFFLSDYNPKEPPDTVHFSNPNPDTNREVLEFNWETYKYVYKDSQPNTLPRKKFPNYQPYPDLYVGTLGGQLSEDHIRPKKPIILLIEGKRYRVWYKLNGETELIPIR
jgi:hypothetical protein